jgi:hypothetical protein
VRIVLLLAVGLALTASSAHARGLTLHDDGRAVTASTDGRFVASTPSGAPGTAVRVLDTVRWRRWVVATPAGCVFRSVGAATLLWRCGDSSWPSGRTLDLATGAVTDLPQLLPEPGTSQDGASYAGIGRHWIRLERGGYHYSLTRYVDRAGAGPEHGAPRAADLVADPDLPRLYRRLCSPMRPPQISDGVVATVPAPELPVRGGMAASLSGGDVVLQRCGHRAQVLHRCRSMACSDTEQPVLVAGSVAWTEAGRLRVMSLPTRRIRTTAPGTYVSIVGAAGRRLFVRSGAELMHVTL